MLSWSREGEQNIVPLRGKTDERSSLHVALNIRTLVNKPNMNMEGVKRPRSSQNSTKLTP